MVWPKGDIFMNAMAMVQRLKDEDQDFEWYPTTSEIIQIVKSRCEKAQHGDQDVWGAVLDCGAGDGRVLNGITNGKKYAIEKAIPLIQAMPADIVLIGTEFFQSTLIDKPVDVVFSNPPYSEYEAWASKIILEAHARKIFLVIPERWTGSPAIQSALKKREVTAEVIGEFDFLNAERAARAKVNVLYISLVKDRYSREPDDPFHLWFDTEFEFKKADKPIPDNEDDPDGEDPNSLRAKLNKAVVSGKGKVPALVELYNHEMEHLYANFKQISSLDPELLKELGVSKASISGALRSRITGLKNNYWKELFNNLEDITKRLTSKSRNSMLDKLTSQTNVDFTESNIYGVLIWVIKNANYYYNQQLINIVEQMVTEANIVKYKSNQKTYQWNQWRYGRYDCPDASHFGLELRIVLHRHYAINNSPYGWDYPNNLYHETHDFLNDLVTIAKNLNFDIPAWTRSRNLGKWIAGKTKDFDMDYAATKKLMTVRAFMNGNLHIKFNQKFIRRLNIEFGRLKGWLRDEHQAAEELNIPVAEAKIAFDSNRQIAMSNMKLLTVDSSNPKKESTDEDVVSGVSKKPETKTLFPDFD
jgi:hypothetical protein